ncbi:alpha-L-fucosidase [Flavobacterium ovatum]|uniref:alpha-L-fucosidase n=1 Tax=Flavobacterium ovatum TaxID=1928857 RepID=UPI00344F52A6
MNKISLKIIVLVFFSLLFLGFVPKPKVKTQQQLLEEFIDKRFGMFICYNIMSYGAQWGEANFDISKFNPQKLDCNQWADAAVSAGMKYGVLTTKHHEGFCLWDSKFTNYDVASTPYKKDIVQQYTDAFRAKGLAVGLYYSIWDSTAGIDKGTINTAKMKIIKGQITELLTNYGAIDYFVIDGWFWRMGHNEVPYQEIRALIRKLQPNCLITDHTHMQAPYHLDIPYFEGPFGAFPSENNTMASALGHCSVKGNGWFWDEKTPNGLFPKDGVDLIMDKLTTCESRYCNFMLNCMPNREGVLDPIFINLLKDLGLKWKPNTTRATLPNQGKIITNSLPIQSATATSGNANYLIDGTKEKINYYTWESDASFPQTITLDLGKSTKNIEVINIVPQHRSKPAPEIALSEGNITQCKVYTSCDNKNYKEVGTYNWESNNHYRNITFTKSKARYLKIEILAAIGSKAIITELEVGSIE